MAYLLLTNIMRSSPNILLIQGDQIDPRQRAHISHSVPVNSELEFNFTRIKLRVNELLNQIAYILMTF